MSVVNAKVIKNLPNQIFELELDNGHHVKAHLATEMKMRYIRLLPGDLVCVEISDFDSGRGRILDRREVKAAGG